MKDTKNLVIIPEAIEKYFSGKFYKCNGFKNLPRFFKDEFELGNGDWIVKRIIRKGTGIEIKNKSIDTWGKDETNFATIVQLVIQGNGYLPEGRIDEDLIFKFRGFHIDIARGGVPTVETFKRILKWLFMLKYNYFGIYFEDLFPWKKYRSIGRQRGRVSRTELKTVIEYGKRLGIEVFPSMNFSGHMENILSLPEFKKFSEWRSISYGACIDLSNRRAREFTYELLQEVVDFFPSDCIHIGGDESWLTGRGKSLEKTWKFEGPKLYESHHRRLIKIVTDAGKVPIIWGDMIGGRWGQFGHGEGTAEEEKKWSMLTGSKTWKSAIVANWEYFNRNTDHFRGKIRKFQDKGLLQLASPGLVTCNTFYPGYSCMVNIRNFLSAARHERTYGFLLTEWGDGGHECLYSFLDPLILATIELSVGNENWKDKWLALTKEKEDVFEVRKLFGKPEASGELMSGQLLRHFLYRTTTLKEMTAREQEKAKHIWEKIISDVEHIDIPEDLSFIRKLLKLGIGAINKTDSVADYFDIARDYSRLWLSERKPEGLEKIISKFWSSASQLDFEKSHGVSFPRSEILK